MKKKRIKITILGVGGGGNNSVSNLYRHLNEMNYTSKESDWYTEISVVAMNTDAQCLEECEANLKVHLGDNGLGAGSCPEVGREAAKYSREEIMQSLEGSDLAIIISCLGGGTGSGAAPEVSAIAKEMGILVIGILTKPFLFEGKKRMNIALKAIDDFRDNTDLFTVISNQMLFSITSEYTTFKDAFKMVDDMCAMFVNGILSILNNGGLINVDFADLARTIREKGDGIIGIGAGSGDHAASEATRQALSNPLIEYASMKGASNALVNIFGDDITLNDVETVMETIYKELGEEVSMIHGVSPNKYFDYSSINKGFLKHAADAQKYIVVMIIAAGNLKNSIIKEPESQIIEQDNPISTPNIKEAPKEEASIFKILSSLKKTI